MKLSLPLKLGIFVVLLFAAVTTTCLLWTPVKARYYAGKLRSNNPKERIKAVDRLLEMGEKGVNALAKDFEGGKEAVQLLIENWSVVNSATINIGEDRYYPLHITAKKGYARVARMLIDKGADVKVVSTAGETPLHDAAWYGHTSVAALLITEGADVKAETMHGKWTPLHSASYWGREAASRLLISKGADVNAKNAYDITPIKMAVEHDHKDVVMLLITKKANINAIDYIGKTPLDYAPSDEIKSLLRAHGAKTGQELRKKPRE